MSEINVHRDIVTNDPEKAYRVLAGREYKEEVKEKIEAEILQKTKVFLLPIISRDKKSQQDTIYRIKPILQKAGYMCYYSVEEQLHLKKLFMCTHVCLLQPYSEMLKCNETAKLLELCTLQGKIFIHRTFHA